MRKIIFFLISLALSFSTFGQDTTHVIKISDDIKILKLSEKAYVHISVTEIPPFGNVSSNGLILLDEQEAFLFDTPMTNEQTKILVDWISRDLNAEITTFIAGHWHGDCMGGLEYIHSRDIASYANEMTIAIADEHGLPLPENGFRDSLSLKLLDLDIYCYYPGPGHSLDNIVIWIPSEKILFGGCFIKDMSSSGLGNTADGDVILWPNSLEKTILMFPDAEIVIPGHGETGGPELLDHTRKLLDAYAK